MNQSSPIASTSRRILIACIGNIFFGDDGFGVEVARRLLSGRRYPENVQIIDFGIRGIDLAYTLLEDYEALVLVDAVPPRGNPAGTLYLIEPDLTSITSGQGVSGQVAPDGHSMDPVKVLAFARTLGARPLRTLLVGCEPATPGGEDGEEMQMGLSEPVQAAIEGAVKMINSLVEELLTANIQ